MSKSVGRAGKPILGASPGSVDLLAVSSVVGPDGEEHQAQTKPRQQAHFAAGSGCIMPKMLPSVSLP